VTDLESTTDELSKSPATGFRAWEGFIFACLAGLGYSTANIFLRMVSDQDPAWVSCVKAIPTLVFVIPWLLLRYQKGHRATPSRRLVLLMMAVSIVGHLAGNVVFQWSLGIIGLALAVPVTTGSMILASAVLGWWLLKEQVSNRTIVAILILFAAIVLLSFGSDEATESVLEDPDAAARSLKLATLSVLLVCGSGIGYALFGIVIRHCVQNGMSNPMVLFISSTVGFIVLLIATFISADASVISNTSPEDLTYMLLAGVCNFQAFACLVVALRLLTVTSVNLLNSSQIAIAAIAGVVFFNEPITTPLVLGVMLTIAGVMTIGSARE